jgi:hypothetical protein
MRKGDLVRSKVELKQPLLPIKIIEREDMDGEHRYLKGSEKLTSLPKATQLEPKPKLIPNLWFGSSPYPLIP